MTLSWRKRNNRSNMRFHEWLVIASASIMTAAIDVKSFERPKYVGGHRTPDTLNLITLGQLIQLSEAKTVHDAFYIPCRVILGMAAEEVDNSLAVDVVRFAGWTAKQLDGINDIFGRLKPEYSAEEMQAGADRLRFGVFGLVDWYACRMGIVHDAAEATPWVNVYECMRMDNERAAYQRRLQKIMLNKSRHNR